MMKSKKQIKSLVERLTRLPQIAWHETHHHADYVELMCLVSKDGVFTVAEYADLLRELKKNLNEDPDDYSYDYDDDETVSEAAAPILSVNDKFTERAKEVFEQIKGRTAYFKEDYPFFVSGNSASITLKEDLDYTTKLYIFLLFCASLQYTGEEKSDLTSAFEMLSYRTMKLFVPQGWQVKYVGASNTYYNYSLESQKFYDKCERLAKWFHVGNKVKKDTYSDNNVGDGGLDIVAWLPTGDEEDRNPIFFGQCACSVSEWMDKQHEATDASWDNKLELAARPKSFMFIPFSYRKADGRWFNDTLIHKANVLIDRRRYLYFFKHLSEEDKKDILMKLEVDKFIKKFTDAKKTA